MSIDTFPFFALLLQRDSDLAGRYSFIQQELAANIPEHINFIEEFLEYGPEHCKNVEETIDMLLPQKVKTELNVHELFLLLCAIQFHRIGVLYKRESNEQQSSLLLDYPERTYDYLHEHYDEWHLSKHEASLIKQICLGLAVKSFPELPESQVLQRSAVRLKFLSALLRLGNALDIVDNKTVSNYLRVFRKVSSASIEQWIKRTDIAGIEIHPDSWSITVHIAPATVEGREYLREFIGKKIQSEIDLARPVLNKYGLFYTTVQMELVHDDKQRDEKILKALQSFYNIREQIDSRNNPYKFLDYFETGDTHFFFGRQSDIQRFAGYIRGHNLVVLYGESGVGKTSLINAGLIPALIADGCVPVYSRCLDEPDQVIKRETSGLISLFSSYRFVPDSGLEEFLSHATHFGYKLVIFVDQFEEFFIRFPQNVQDEFIAQLINCLNRSPALNITFVLSLRRDYFVELGRYKSRLLELFNNAFELRKLTANEIEESITEPANQIGIHYEPQLIKELVQDIYQGGNYNTPHIQIICDKLIRALDRSNENTISLSLYEKLGRAKKILSEYLDAEINRFPTSKQALAKSILKELVTSHKTKTVSTISEIALRIQVSFEETENLLQELVNNSRLLRKIDVQGSTVYELSHEFLVDRVGEWLGEEDLEVKAVYEMLDRQLIEWNRYGFFLDKERLNQVNQYRDRLSLNDEKKALILASYLHNDLKNVDKLYWIESMEIHNSIRVVVDSMDTSKAETYQECILLLIRLGEASVENLLPFLSSTNWLIRQGVIDAIVGFGPRSIMSLLSMLNSQDRRVRRSASTALAKLGEVSRKPLEEKLATESDNSVVKESLALLDFYQSNQ